MRIVERATDREEVREQEVAIDQPIHALCAGALLELLQRLARAGEQCAPSAPAKHRDRGLRAVALRSGRDIKRRLRAPARRQLERAAQRERSPIGRDVRLSIGADGDGHEAGLRAALEQNADPSYRVRRATHRRTDAACAREAADARACPASGRRRDRRRAAVLEPIA